MFATSAFAQHDIIRNGLDWIISQQNYQGYWGGDPDLRIRDSCEVIETLRLYGQTTFHYQNAISWLRDDATPISNDYISRRISALEGSGLNVSLLRSELVNCQNSDYGWGEVAGYNSNIIDTIVALKALQSETPNLSSVISLIRSKKEIGKGWDYKFSKFNYPAISKIYPTAVTLLVIADYVSLNDSTIQEARQWLLSSQNPDNGFGFYFDINGTVTA